MRLPDFERGDHVELGEALLERLESDRDNLVYDESSAWKYDPVTGIWAPVDSTAESVIVQGFAGCAVSTGRGTKPLNVTSSSVRGAIELAHDQISKRHFFSGCTRGISFTNGFLEVGKSVVPHSREHRARHAYGFDYEAGQKPAKFLKFLGELFECDTDKEDKISLVQEFFGAALFGIATDYQRCIIGLGGGDNGKSSLAEIMLDVMPPGTTTSIPPQEWSDEYRRASFAGILLNVVGELPEREMIAGEAFKAIVAGDKIQGRSPYEKPFTFQPLSAHYFAANKLPSTRDTSHGFWRRFVLLTFNNKFPDGDPRRNPYMAEEILAVDRAALVSWLADGAARLVTQKRYTIPASHAAALAQWKENADQVACFLVDKSYVGGKAKKRASDLYAEYRRWALDNGHNALASNTFGVRMGDRGFQSKRDREGAYYEIIVKPKCDGLDEGLSSPLSAQKQSN